MTNPSESEITKIAQLLSDLQKQLIKYKTALDSIDTASSATQNVAHEIEELSKTFRSLGQSQTDMTQHFEETRRALLFTQQKSQQVRKDMDEMSQNFTRNINAGLQATLQNIDEKLSRFVAPDRDMLRQEVRKLKFFLFINILVMFVLFFSAFMYFYQGTPVNNTASTAMPQRTVEPQQPQRQTPVTTPANTYVAPKIQVLNGCGVDGVAKNFVNFLNAENFAVTNAENADNFQYGNSLIFLNGDYPDEAQEVARLLGIPVERIQPGRGKWPGYNISVVIGRDYQALKARR